MATPLWPSYLPTPEQGGYRVRRGNDSIAIRLDGGPARVRRDSLGTPHQVSVTFMCTEEEYTGLIGFCRERAQSRTRFFRIPLLIDVPVAVNYRARILDEPEALESTRGLTFLVGATLEVLPNPIKSLSVICQNVDDPRVVDAGTIDYAGEMSEFPVGRNVLLTGCSGLSNSTPVSLDGTYEIASKPNAFSIELENAASVNSDWTVLNGTVSQLLTPTNNRGACILLPE